MEDIRAIPWNGLKVVSTFSGCGGSCTGYRMAGFKVVWANEFVPAAQESYRANASADCYLDCRDVRTIKPDEILTQCGLQHGELDLFDGSPPCSSFSTAGTRESSWGKVKRYSDTAQRTDDLFFEYIRILRGLMPKAFVAENVTGLVKGTAKGMFLEILRDLKASGYRVTCKILDAKWLGVPQSRQRTIFIGVRNDLNLDPVYPKPLPYFYSVRDALPWIIRVRKGGGFGEEHYVGADTVGADTVGAQPSSGNNFNNGAYTVEVETDLSRYAIGAEWERLSIGEQSRRYPNLVKVSATEPCPTVTALGAKSGFVSVTHPTEKRKFTIAELKRICAFPDDFILTGSYAQQWERLGRSVPPVMMFHIAKEIRDKILTP
jgi:DNA (cytosine-5)-methyltransferase 1